MTKKIYAWVLALGFVGIGTLTVWAAAPSGNSNGPIQVTANVLTYDRDSQLLNASGQVIATQGNDTLKGDLMEYHLDSQNGFVTGNVIVNRAGGVMTAARVDLRGGDTYIASGGVFYQSPTESFSAPWLEYTVSTQFVRTQGRTKLVRSDGVIWADQMEGSQRTGNMIARGNVDFQSDLHQVTGSGDRLDYQKSGDNQGTVVLTGNAQLIQRGKNTLTGPKIRMNLDTGLAEAEGRPTLIFTPENRPASTGSPEISK